MILMVLSTLYEASNQPLYVCAYDSMTKATGVWQEICCLCTASLAWGIWRQEAHPWEAYISTHALLAVHDPAAHRIPKGPVQAAG